jgi:hypothetical protein
MRLPGFVAEASLLGIGRSRNRRTAGGGARHLRQTSGTITPQQGLRVDALSYAGTFYFFSPCLQRCEHDQVVARAQCVGSCSKYLNVDPALYTSCVDSCTSGKDFVDGAGKKLAGEPVLRPGFCDARCGGLAARWPIWLPYFAGQ